MAFKSPGIYFTEIDNTEYTNPAAEINTTVAIIGFAKKGPIGEPIEINSYNDFKSVFGTPIAGTYAGLAVRSVLSAGGTVLYVRIADESLASKSNVILKNYSEKTDGALIINNKNAIPVGAVINGKTFSNGVVYSSIIGTETGNEKEVFIRTPKEGRLTLTDVISQLNEGLKDQFGFQEFDFVNPKKEGYKVFGIKLNSNTEEGYRGPYFVNIAENEKPELVVESINNALTKGTNPYQIFRLDKRFGIGKIIYDSTGVGTGIEFEEGDITTAKFRLPTERTNTRFNFNVKKGSDSEPFTIGFELSGEEEGYIKLTELEDAINKALEQNAGGKIKCKFIYNKKITNEQGASYKGDIDSLALLFFSIDYDEFQILPYYNGDTYYEKSLFLPLVDSKIYENPQTFLPGYATNYPIVNIDDDGFSFTNVDSGNETKYRQEEGKLGEINIAKENEGENFSKFNFAFAVNNFRPSSFTNESDIVAEYNEYTNSIIIKANEKLNDSVVDTKIEIKDFDFVIKEGVEGATDKVANAEYLFRLGLPSSNSSSHSLLYDSLIVQNRYSIGDFVREYIGQKGIDESVMVYRDSEQRVCIRQRNSMEPPTITNESGNTLNDLFGPLTTEEEFKNLNYSVGKDYVLLKREGSIGVDSTSEDMIIFTSTEYGSGTNNVGIEIFTSVSPIDETSVEHYIDLYVDGIKKESWENVSYDPNDDNYFVKLINAEPENGGSSYVSVKVKRGNVISGPVKVPDTATLTSNGIIYLGTAINSSSVNYFNSDAEGEEDIERYDYKLGNDGRPSGDPSDLFMNAMNKETSGLSNKDLYSWHILITPDDGQREEIQNEAISLCEYMEDAIYIADPPQGLSRDGVINWHNGSSQQRSTALVSNYCCTYWPWLKIYNAIESKYQYVMPSVIMASQFCKVDNSYAPWYAPAGSTNGYCSTALDLEVNSKDKRYPNKIDRDKLYLDQNRINPFLKLRNGNILAYGEKTCQRKNSTLTKIHTRRMLISLKKDLNSAIKGFIFQPTVGENINKIRNNVTTIMESYKTGGAISWYVVDTSMNTTETLQQDILYVAISCVPVGCIEQVEITFTLNKSAE